MTGRAVPAVRLVLLGLLALVAVGGTGRRSASLAPEVSAAGSTRTTGVTEVLHAARQQAVNFTTLDYRHLDRDLGRVLDGATGDFRKQFRAGTTDLTALVTANKAVADGEVLEAGLVIVGRRLRSGAGGRGQHRHQHGEPQGREAALPDPARPGPPRRPLARLRPPFVG